jgi:pimeloyl-ACP methyl ester carboxylesterase
MHDPHRRTRPDLHHRAAAASASAIAHAALTRPMWLNAWGKLPNSSPFTGSTSSANSPEIVGERGRPFEHGARPLGPAGHGQRLGQPERAQQERALVAVETVSGPVAVDEPAVVGEVLLGGIDGRQHPRIVGREEPDKRQHEVGGIQVVAAERLGERIDPIAPGVAQDGLADGVPRGRPTSDAVTGAETVGQPVHRVRARPARDGLLSQIVTGASYQEPAMRAAVKRHLTQLDLRDVTLLGESMGAVLSLTTAADLSEQVRRVLAISPYHYRGGILRSSLLARFIITGVLAPRIGPILARQEPKPIMRAILKGGLVDTSALRDDYLDERSKSAIDPATRPSPVPCTPTSPASSPPVPATPRSAPRSTCIRRQGLVATIGPSGQPAAAPHRQLHTSAERRPLHRPGTARRASQPPDVGILIPLRREDSRAGTEAV